MARSLTAAMLAAIASGSVKPALFVKIAFNTDTVYMWSGVGSVTPPGPAAEPSSTFPYTQTFIGAGWLGQVSSMPEIADVVAQNIVLTLSGIPAELIGDVVSNVQQNSSATVWLAFLDAANNVLGDPAQCFQGDLDVPTVSEGAAITVSITCENPLVDLNRAPNRRFNDIDQQGEYPGDLGMSMVSTLQNMYIQWPMNISTTSGAGKWPQSLAVTPTTSAIGVGQTVTLTATLTYSDLSTASVTGDWSSSDENVCTVVGGVVTGKSPGSSTINVLAGGLSFSVVVQVT